VKSSPSITNFNSGEFSPLLEGRVDFERYANGCVLMENFIPTVQGPAVRRGGTRYVASVKTPANRVWLQSFEFSQDQAYVLEFGDQYVRFYTQNGQLVSGMTPVEVATPYTQANLFNADGTCRLRFAQSGDFLYITHPLYPPTILKRTSPTTFVLDLFLPTGGPFKDVDPDQTIKVYASATTGTVTLTATSGVFLSGHVGSLFLMESQTSAEIPSWEAGKRIAGPGDSVLGLVRRSDGKFYECVTNYTVPGGGVEARTGTSKPVHSLGVVADGDGNSVTSAGTMFANRQGFDWLFLHAGYGWVEITAVPTIAAVSRAITGAADNGSGLVRITSTAHGFTSGDVITIAGVTGTTEANGTWTITVIGPNTFDLVGSAFVNAYVSGGTASSVPGSKATATVLSRLPAEVVGTGNATTRWAHAAWSGVEGWPSSITFFRERLCFARGQRIWMSVAAGFDDFSARNLAGEVAADQAISLEVASGEINEIQWLHPDRELIAGTAGGEFTIGELTNGDPLGPGNIKVQLQSRFGTRGVPPVGSGQSTLFLLRSGTKLREIAYEFTSDGYQTKSATTLAEHITKPSVIDMDYALDPYSVVWCVRSDGLLLGFTWNNEEQVKGWHRHQIGGAGIVESVAVIPRPDNIADQVWMVVRRTINGQTTRYVEYMESPWERGQAQADAFYVDSGLTYSGAPATTISGLTHLEGQVVDVLTDGAPHPQRTVTSGAITLQRPASKVQVGLPCPPRLLTMRLEVGSKDGTDQGKTKRIHKVTFRLQDSAVLKVGPNASSLQQVEFRTPADPMDAPPPLFSGDKLVAWPSGYETEARMYVTADQPTPLTLVAIFPQVFTQDAR
jgi:hypothetical protein